MKVKNSIAFGLLLISLSAIASPTYVEGQDYTRLPAQVRSKATVKSLIATDPDKVQLLLFFSYGCPACARFDPAFEQWIAAQHNKQLVIYRFPVSFEENWESLAKMYYVMQDLEPRKDLNAEIFNAIHKQHISLWQESIMQQFFQQHGYAAQKVAEIYDSYEVSAQAKLADTISMAFEVNETPTIVVNGPQNSYLLTPDQTSGDDSKLLKIVSYLISQEEKKL